MRLPSVDSPPRFSEPSGFLAAGDVLGDLADRHQADLVRGRLASATSAATSASAGAVLVTTLTTSLVVAAVTSLVAVSTDRPAGPGREPYWPRLQHRHAVDTSHA